MVRRLHVRYTADWRVGYAPDNVGYSGIFWDIWSLMFFRKDPPQTERRRNADHRIKTEPEQGGAEGNTCLEEGEEGEDGGD